MAEPDKKARLTLELPLQTRQQMDEIAAQTGAASVTEVIRKAVALYGLLLDEDGKLLPITVTRPGQEPETIRFI